MNQPAAPQQPFDEAALTAIAVQVANSHSKFAVADVAEVLQLAVTGKGLAAPAGWAERTALDIVSGHIKPSVDRNAQLLRAMAPDEGHGRVQ